MESPLTYMSADEVAQSIQTRALELTYERALRQAERIYEEERVRALRVQLLLLEDENFDFQDQVAEKEVELGKVEDSNDELHQQLSETEANLQQAQLSLKARLRDIENYKTEVTALNATSADATKVLAEKLSLAREVATVKTELDHLRSQTSTQQNLLAEKLALQRELSALQVELETEKRTVQRIKAHDKSAANDESALVTEIEELKKEVARAHREAQKNDRENRKKSMEFESQKEILEGKLEAFRNKLRLTKEQLKEAQDGLEKAQASKMAQSAEMTKARITGANPKKRPVARFDPDMTIGTPGHGGPAAKKQRTSVSVGDKSAFSITPFLNRTMSILPESPSEEEKDEYEKADEVITKQIDSFAEQAEKAAVKAKISKPAIPISKMIAITAKIKTLQPLKESTNPKANAMVKKSSLSKVTEEASEGEEQGNENTENADPAEETVSDPVKKKQKVLNKRTNIFDEEDDQSKKTVQLKPRPLTATGLRGGGLTTSSLGKISLASVGKVGKGKLLAEFSPLKKDRRAVVMASSTVAPVS